MRVAVAAIAVLVVVATPAAGTVQLGSAGAGDGANPSRVQATGVVERVAGSERITTAVAASQHGWDHATVAVVSTAADFPDALAAGPLAAALAAPVLLTAPMTLPDETAAEVDRLGVDRVVLLGGTVAVSADVEAALRALPGRPTVERLGGSDRTETAALAARAAAAAAPADPVEIAVVTGDHFADALAAGALGLPLLLVSGDAVPEATVAALDDLAPAALRLVGGRASIGSDVEAVLRAHAPSVTRSGGDAPYETATVVLAQQLARRTEPGPLVVVTGDAWPDGLAGAALAARTDGTLALVPTRRLTDDLDALLRRHAADVTGALVVGGPVAVGDFASTELAAALDGAPRPGFEGVHGPLPAPVRDRMTGVSWRAGCPVGLDDLALLELDHWGFDGVVHRGEVVVAATVAADLLGVFAALFDAGVPLQRVALVDDYGADDDASMADNNSSGFNCRTVAGTGTWSEHAYGLAVDLNPIQNPYVRGGDVHPPAGAAFLDRDDVRPGMAVRPGPVVDAFEAIGWGWGGDFSSLKDYQHFSASGR